MHMRNFPIFGQPYDTLIIIGLAVAMGAWRPLRMAWRMTQPIPSDDRAAIDRVLQRRRQHLVSITKLWVGGPWHIDSIRFPIPYQGGRPYRVEVTGGDADRLQQWRRRAGIATTIPLSSSGVREAGRWSVRPDQTCRHWC